MNDVAELCELVGEVLQASAGSLSEEIGPDTELLVSGLLDSLTIMTIVREVESRSGISLPDTAVVASNFRTPRRLWDAITQVRDGQGARAGARP